MNEKILQKLLDYIQNTEDFILEQVPDTIMQMFRYEKISNLLTLGLMLILISLAIFGGLYMYYHPKLDKYGHREVISVIGPMVCAFFTPFAILQICINVDRLIKIYFAPKYFLINLILKLKS